MWADGKAVKNEFDVQLLDLLGPKTDADLAPAPKQVKQPKDKQAKAKKSEDVKKGERARERKIIYCEYLFLMKM